MKSAVVTGDLRVLRRIDLTTHLMNVLGAGHLAFFTSGNERTGLMALAAISTGTSRPLIKPQMSVEKIQRWFVNCAARLPNTEGSSTRSTDCRGDWTWLFRRKRWRPLSGPPPSFSNRALTPADIVGTMARRCSSNTGLAIRPRQSAQGRIQRQSCRMPFPRS